MLLAHRLPLVGRERELLALRHVEALGALLLKVLHQLADGQCLLLGVVVERHEHLLEGPLCPVVIAGVACAHLAVPVEAESDLVELLAVVVDVCLGGDGRVLAGLDGILLGGQSVSVVSHGVEHVEATLALVACVYVAGNIA